jgi:transmembrane sensor
MSLVIISLYRKDMNETQKIKLLQKYNEGTATSEEQGVVESWQLGFPLEGRRVLGDKETKADLAEIRTNLLRISGKGKTRLLWYRISAAAALAMIALSTGLYFYPHSNAAGRSVAELAKHDIRPGRNTATLTLANGSKIVLAESIKGKLATESGISITKNADGQIVYKLDDVSGAVISNKSAYNTLSTAKGEQYQVNLPDGTKVWLNAASSLTYAPSFSGKSERRVQLSGEAYFEVAKDKLHPFVVKTLNRK